jgi:phosphopantothenoylcysteine synthetase/decarboxylase
LTKQAITKLNNEMTSNKNNPYVQVVGNFLLQNLKKNPNAAEKILNKDKSILKSLDAMRKEAEKVKVGNCAVLTDEQGFAVVLDYFEIKESVEVKPKPKKVPKETKNDVDQPTLFDFVEEA